VLVMVSRSRRVFSALAVALALAITLLAPAAWSADWSAFLPAAAAAYLSPATGSLFPLVPWSAFILAGAALGQVYARWGASHLPAFANRALLLPGALLILAGMWLTSHQVALFGNGAYAFVPGNIVVRAGVCLLIVGGIAHASRAVTELPHMFGAVAQESLLVYGLHLFIVFGSVWAPGLLSIYGPTRTPAQLLPIVVLLISSMMLAAHGWNWLKHSHQRVAWWSSVAVGCLMLEKLVF
jgi:hypothetical protein